MSQQSSDDRIALLGIARRAISSAVIENRLPDFQPFPSQFNVPQGVFVTLYCGGKLRGCVGHMEDPNPLAEGVTRAAINAALHDPRFSPVVAEEIPILNIEISLLSPPEKIAPDAILAGQHGVLVIQPPHRGLLLPHVATQRGWSRQRLLEETCAKAGLPNDAWRDPATQIFAFTAEVFSEAQFEAILRA